MQAEATTEPPVVDALYRKDGHRGRWRVETAGPKWVQLRSLELCVDGRWLSHREPRPTWPNGWVRT